MRIPFQAVRPWAQPSLWAPERALQLDAKQLTDALPMRACIESMREGFGPSRDNPLREQKGSTLFMPAAVGEVSGFKAVSVVPGSPSGVVVLFDALGRLLGLVDGPSLTSLRTGAASGLATELLALQDAKRLVQFGTGFIAYDQIRAVLAARPSIQQVTLVHRGDPTNCLALRARLEEEGLPVRVEWTGDPRRALHEADVINTATPSKKALFSAQDVSDRVHVNAVGAFRLDMCEVPADLMHRAYVVVDDYRAAAAEAGDLALSGKTADAELGAVLSSGCRPGGGPSVFKSVGVGSQDIAAGLKALAHAPSGECLRGLSLTKDLEQLEGACMQTKARRLGSMSYQFSQWGQKTGAFVRHFGAPYGHLFVFDRFGQFEGFLRLGI